MKKYIILISFALIFVSCSERDEILVDDTYAKETITNETNPQMEFAKEYMVSKSQAYLYANMFSKYLNTNETIDASAKSENEEKIIENVDYLIENGDTLMYSFNYINGGFILIGADNSSFPILAHSKTGFIKFKDIDSDNPLSIFIENAKEKIYNSLSIGNTAIGEYYDNWKDLGKDGYEYEITLQNDEPLFPSDTKGRRKTPSGKTSIYPYTGKILEYWCQKGGYNFYSENNACIGCPALAIGMLLFDCSQRLSGNSIFTDPYFYFNEIRDLSKVDAPTETSLKLRQIADSIPNYIWGQTRGASSGATPQDELIGLHKLGFKNASLVSYDFERLYQQLSFYDYNYMGQYMQYNRGVLIRANAPNGGGHIWFCDGYYEQAYVCKKKFLGKTIKQWNEYDDRLYMNWGWGPNGYNGWYCATDTYWTSLENDFTVYYKTNCQMFINLYKYEIY